jgi:cytosine/adenosine deaminase-related metal-dependent hydrolase
MYAANLIAALDALDSGITTLVDWSHNNNSPEHADASIQALFDSGIRAVFAYGNSNDEWLPISETPQSRDVVRIADKWFSSGDQLVTLALAPRGPQFVTKVVTLRDFALARELDIPVTVHTGDGVWGKSHPVKWMDENGLTDEQTTYVQCNTLADEEYDIIARTGGAISMAPEPEMHMGHGRLATLRARGRDIPLSLSSDVCASVGGDMFSAMRTLLAGTRDLVDVEALETGQFADPLTLTAAEALGFATQGGATAAWLWDTVGSLTPGKRADVILVRTDVYGMRPLNCAANAVVESGNPSLVDTVLVNGQPVKRGGVLLGHDFASIRRQAEEARDRVLARVCIEEPEPWQPGIHAPAGGAATA